MTASTTRSRSFSPVIRPCLRIAQILGDEWTEIGRAQFYYPGSRVQSQAAPALSATAHAPAYRAPTTRVGRNSSSSTARIVLSCMEPARGLANRKPSVSPC
jgi:hypothetical protein